MHQRGLFLTKHMNQHIINTRKDLGRKLSNFYLLDAPIVLDDEEFWTVEAAYQASKVRSVFNDRSLYRLFAGRTKEDTNTPAWAGLRMKKMCSELLAGRPAFDPTTRLSLMKMLLDKKFVRGGSFADVLCSTRTSLIVEQCSNDLFWGCVDPNLPFNHLNGHNHLGRLLQSVRTELAIESMDNASSIH
jgi:ribA/ribD-fused uncharacterized protein